MKRVAYILLAMTFALTSCKESVLINLIDKDVNIMVSDSDTDTDTDTVPVDTVAPPEVMTIDVYGFELRMVKVEGGTFRMGSSNGDDDEYPIRNITLDDFYIGETEVTQGLWKTVMGSNPSSRKGYDLPVESVRWDDCQNFISKLNQITGKVFALPTEAQWEFAARGGNKSRGYEYSGSNSVGDVAWYRFNSSSQTHPVGSKQANELGLYDMSGNVWEWCSDWYGTYDPSVQTNPTGPQTGSDRVNRGGSWHNDAGGCRSAFRNYSAPGSTCSYLGLRLVLLF